MLIKLCFFLGEFLEILVYSLFLIIQLLYQNCIFGLEEFSIMYYYYTWYISNLELGSIYNFAC